MTKETQAVGKVICTPYIRQKFSNFSSCSHSDINTYLFIAFVFVPHMAIVSAFSCSCLEPSTVPGIGWEPVMCRASAFTPVRSRHHWNMPTKDRLPNIDRIIKNCIHYTIWKWLLFTFWFFSGILLRICAYVYTYV